MNLLLKLLYIFIYGQNNKIKKYCFRCEDLLVFLAFCDSKLNILDFGPLV